MPKYTVFDRQAGRQEIEIDTKDYKAAADKGVSLSEHLAGKYPSVDTTHGTVLEQAMASASMFVNPDASTGVRAPTMKEVFDGSARMEAATVRGDGSDRHEPAGRMLFPEVMMQAIRAELTTDHGDYLNAYNRMIAQTASVTSPRFDQPVIDTKGPEGSENQPVAQGSEPPVMVNISLSNRSYRVPQSAIGLMITDEAQGASTLDLVNIAMSAQARAERVRMVDSQIRGMINGDADLGEKPIQGRPISHWDSSISSAGKITQKAWVKFLRNEYRKRSLGGLMMTLDTAMKVEDRDGKPTKQGDNPSSPRIDSIFTIENLGIPNPQILLVEPDIVPEDTIVGLDTRYAIRRVVNVNASYQAIEDFVMRRSTGYRVDYGESSYKLYPDAWDMTTLSVG